MSLKSFKMRYYLSELWAVLGIGLIFHFFYFISQRPDNLPPRFLFYLFVSLVLGFGHSIFLNSRFIRALLKSFELHSRIDDNFDFELQLHLRRQIFQVPLKRALWMFERFAVSGILLIIMLNFLKYGGLTDLAFYLFVFLTGGFASSILLFLFIEGQLYEVHRENHRFLEHANMAINSGTGITVYHRLYAAFLSVILFVILFILLGSMSYRMFNPGAGVSASFQSQNLITLLIMSGVFALYLLILAYYIGRNLNEAIQSLIIALGRAERGDLGTRTPVLSADEIGSLANQFNAMMKVLSEIFGKVQSVSDSVTSVADRLSTSSVEMSEGVELQATSTDSTANSMAQMQASITEVADSVDILFKETGNTSQSILEMTSSIEEVASNIENLSHSIDSTSTSIEEMNSSIKQVADNSVVLNRSTLDLFRSTDDIIRIINQVEQWAIESSKLSNKVTDDADMGHQAVLQTVEGMEKIRRFFQTTGEVITQLGERSGQIGKIITVIDDVSSQTNLLALNAAIISAQAGEHGKEFSVVADEIRDLAEKATSSTKIIANLIKAVQAEALKAVHTMEEGASLVAEGVKLSHRAGDTLTMIIKSSTESAKMTNLIEDATLEQVSKSQEISKAVERLKIMSHQIAGATKEQKIGISQIMRESENMREMALQVRFATEKQTEGSRFISKAVSEVKEMVERIRVATTQEKTESRSILEAVEVFKDITLKNVDSMVEMDKAVDKLAAQVRSLESQVSRFKV